MGDILHGTLLRKDEQCLNGEILRCIFEDWEDPIE